MVLVPFAKVARVPITEVPASKVLGCTYTPCYPSLPIPPPHRRMTVGVQQLVRHMWADVLRTVKECSMSRIIISTGT